MGFCIPNWIFSNPNTHHRSLWSFALLKKMDAHPQPVRSLFALSRSQESGHRHGRSHKRETNSLGVFFSHLFTVREKTYRLIKTLTGSADLTKTTDPKPRGRTRPFPFPETLERLSPRCIAPVETEAPRSWVGDAAGSPGPRPEPVPPQNMVHRRWKAKGSGRGLEEVTRSRKLQKVGRRVSVKNETGELGRDPI